MRTTGSELHHVALGGVVHEAGVAGLALGGGHPGAVLGPDAVVQHDHQGARLTQVLAEVA